MRLVGMGVSSGRSCAPLMVYRRAPAPAAVDDAGADRLERALQAASAELASMIAQARQRLGEREAEIFEVQAALLADPEWLAPIRDRVAAGGSPEAVVAEVSEESAAEIAALEDEYLRERAADIRDLGQRVVGLLAGGRSATPMQAIGAREVVLAAEDLSPSEALSLDPAFVRGIAIEGGGRTSHMAILARQLGIPAVVGVRGLVAAVRDGVVAAVDGDAGTVELDPPQRVVRRFLAASGHGERVVDEPVLTPDGTRVHVLANAASPADVRRAVASGADGIGLYRTEFLFFDRSSLPSEGEQAEVYAEAAQSAGGRPITFRTLDVGGDKPLGTIAAVREENPFLGMRGIRFSLAHPALLETQLRALLSVAGRYRNVRVMLPMVSTLEEVERVRRLVGELPGADAPPALGAMIEVPAAAILAAELAAATDFLSVGTNDLTQYLLAVDRGSETLGHLYDELHPAVLRTLSSIAAAVAGSGCGLSLCGELASRPGAAGLLVGLGYRTLSVVAPQVQTVKRAVQVQSVESAVALARRMLRASSATEAQRLLGERGEVRLP